jgi:hypothetical protein
MIRFKGGRSLHCGKPTTGNPLDIDFSGDIYQAIE